MPILRKSKPDFIYGSNRFNKYRISNNPPNYIKLIRGNIVFKSFVKKQTTLYFPYEDIRNIYDFYPHHNKSWARIGFIIGFQSISQNKRALAFQTRCIQSLKNYLQELIDELFTETKNMLEIYFQEKDAYRAYRVAYRIVFDLWPYIRMKDPSRIEDHDDFIESFYGTSRIEYIFNAFKNRDVKKIISIIKTISHEMKMFEKDKLFSRSKTFLHNDKKFLFTKVSKFLEKPVNLNIDYVIGDTNKDIDLVAIDERHEKIDLLKFKADIISNGEIEEKSIDLFIIPKTIKKYQIPNYLKKSFQPFSMILAVNATPVSELGKSHQQIVRSYFSINEICTHYFSACYVLLEDSENENSFAYRFSNNFGLNRIIVPLYRITNDLLPKAIYMKEQNEYPTTKYYDTYQYKDLAFEIDSLFDKDITIPTLLKYKAIILEILKQYTGEKEYLIYKNTSDKYTI